MSAEREKQRKMGQGSRNGEGNGKWKEERTCWESILVHHNIYNIIWTKVNYTTHTNTTFYLFGASG